jgi:hypothetical protein
MTLRRNRTDPIITGFTGGFTANLAVHAQCCAKLGTAWGGRPRGPERVRPPGGSSCIPASASVRTPRALRTRATPIVLRHLRCRSARPATAVPHPARPGPRRVRAPFGRIILAPMVTQQIVLSLSLSLSLAKWRELSLLLSRTLSTKPAISVHSDAQTIGRHAVISRRRPTVLLLQLDLTWSRRVVDPVFGLPNIYRTFDPPTLKMRLHRAGECW